ncbi:hypothetical protein SDRG_05280 [Saprolegnia diclina VS20]|uniref:Uncharacterized protein n=2 Tax=Saprolegnia diclina (strain VS20) TaxID=1156394 RepID=T0QQP3_SAPDV|nr:hypothetical protein SDRG_05280 [Saprolegnia diclina VS20]EQC37051.1 hypothetical protein SDRG_05280 [Saprolegnia diclina VS20]|eukprot:XP_008609213.1 hypothetical protein SDRG_05280 [Saprolegnia diclina VS20]
MFVWIKYGFDDMPLKMFNTNVTCDILLGFVKASFSKDVDDLCRQKSVKIGIDIEGVKKEREAHSYGLVESSEKTPAELEELQAKYEAQLEELMAVMKTVKESQSAVLDIADAQGVRVKMNERLRDRGLDVIKPRQVYELVRVGENEAHTPLKFAIP